MELFEVIRREYEFGVGTIQGVARKLGVHRRMVREAMGSAVPLERTPATRPRPSLGPVIDFIDAILEADRKAPRKQRHTAHRIYVRITKERREAQVAESTVRQYVRERKHALGLLNRETYVPQSYAWGDEAQVDWYEAEADLESCSAFGETPVEALEEALKAKEAWFAVASTAIRYRSRATAR